MHALLRIKAQLGTDLLGILDSQAVKLGGETNLLNVLELCVYTNINDGLDTYRNELVASKGLSHNV